MVEQLTLNQRVEGSSPPAPTINSTAYRTGRLRLPTFLSGVFQLGFVFLSARDAFSVSRMRSGATDDSKQPTVSGSSVGCGTYRIALRHQLSRRGPLRRRADGDQDPDNDGPQGDGREARFLRNRWRASYRWQEYLHLNPHQCSKETRTCRTATATTKAFTGQPQVTAVMMSDDYRSPTGQETRSPRKCIPWWAAGRTCTSPSMPVLLTRPRR